MLTFTSFGGAGTVTGSKHMLELDGRRMLVDCGLFQGLKNLRELNWAPFPVDPASIDLVVLTHAHLDHSGSLPRLVRKGFQGPILCTPATRDVAELILLDSARLQEMEAKDANRHGTSRHKPALPLYDERDVQATLKHFTPVPFDTPVPLENGADLLFRHAGHILGAATAEVRWGGRTVLFSGDLGRYGDPMLPDPVSGTEADIVVIESTYGNRRHPAESPEDSLADVVARTVARGGTVVIPAFAVGRAQSLLYHLWSLRQADRLPAVPIYLDSPMAIDASELLCAHPDDLRLDPGSCRLACGIATYVRSSQDSKALSADSQPKVIISASGMATGGRVLHHLKAFAPDPRNTVLFAGFQAEGTRGRAMLSGADDIRIHGEWVPVRAEVTEIPALSAHADAGELIRWLSGLRRPPERILIVHGEPDASEALRIRIKRELGWEASVPRQDQKSELG